MNREVVDYPKIKSPFIRKTINGHYVVTPEIDPDCAWIFDPGVRAVDKLHGTNICVNIVDKQIVSIDNRTTRIVSEPTLRIAKGNHFKFILGVLNACERGWLTEDGTFYGELIGPDIHGNIHGVDKYFFVPFDYLLSKCHWKSWINNKYPKDFDSISEWFKGLISLFSERICKKELPAEGLVFYHHDGRRCKLRRDMFDWYFMGNPNAKVHKEEE